MEYNEKPKNTNNKKYKYSSHIGFNGNKRALKLMKLTKNIEQKSRPRSRSILFYEGTHKKNNNDFQGINSPKIIELFPCKRVDSLSSIEYEVNNNLLGYINEIEIMKINKNIHNDINFIKLKNKNSKLKKTMKRKCSFKSTKKIKNNKSFSKGILDSMKENEKKTENANDVNSNIIYKSNLIKRTNTKLGKNEKYRVIIRKNNLYDSFDDEEGKEEEIGFYLSPNSFYIKLFDIVLFFSSIFYFIFIPYFLSKNIFIDKELYSCEVILIIIDIIYILDIIINFFRAYQNLDENLILKSKKIITNYLKTWSFFYFIQGISFFLYYNFTEKYKAE